MRTRVSAVFASCVLPVCLSALSCAAPPSPAAQAIALADIELPIDSEIIPARVRPGATLSVLLRKHDLATSDVEAILAAVESVFDTRRLLVGQPYRLERATTGEVRSFHYEIDSRRYLSVVVNGDKPRTFTARVEEYDIETTSAVVNGAINIQTPSLFEATAAAGEGPDLAIALADIFAGEVDFNSELQPGDEFSVVVEKAAREGQFIGYGAIEAAQLVNEGRVLRATRFAPEGGKPGYFDDHGRSLRRFFLRSPLKFDPRVTSRFSRSRLHPILNIRRPHLGVDYQAGGGAPVVAVSHGTVTMAARTRGGGRTVKIRHASGYESAYLHLSAFGPGIRAGARVTQGQLIGRVGASGLATAPHLHYELRKNGRPVNPVAEHRKMPPGDPVPADHLDAFRAVRDSLLARLARPDVPAFAAN